MTIDHLLRHPAAAGHPLRAMVFIFKYPVNDIHILFYIFYDFIEKKPIFMYLFIGTHGDDRIESLAIYALRITKPQ